jgi:hypothetical protein
MGREYTVSTGMKIFYILLAVGMFIFAIVLLKIPQLQPVLLLFPLMILAGTVLIIVNVLKRKVVIYDDSIVCINLFSRKEIAFSDIKGCRIGDKLISVEPLSQQTPKIAISNYSDLGDSDQLKSWFRDNFTDLDAADLKQDEEKLLHDPMLGYSEEDRKQALSRAKLIAGAYNIIGPVICFVFLLFHTGIVLIIIGLIYPLIGIPIMRFNHGLIKFLGNSKRSVIPFVVIGFMMPVIFLLIVSITDYQVFSYSNLWIYFGIISIIVFVSIYLTGLNKTISGIIGQTIFMFVMSLIYGFGSVVGINCAFDNSKPIIYVAKVLDHRIESGKHTSYLFTISEWGPMHKEKEEDVGKWIYDNVSIGDSVQVYFHPGKLKAPWYQVHSFAYTGK